MNENDLMAALADCRRHDAHNGTDMGSNRSAKLKSAEIKDRAGSGGKTADAGGKHEHLLQTGNATSRRRRTEAISRSTRPDQPETEILLGGLGWLGPADALRSVFVVFAISRKCRHPPCPLWVLCPKWCTQSDFRPRVHTPDAPSEPGDERHGEWSHQQLLDMDARFCAAMQRVHGSRPDLVNGHRPRRQASGVSSCHCA
jgi:hypothetical protein